MRPLGTTAANRIPNRLWNKRKSAVVRWLAPPAHHQFPDLVPANLVITTTGGTIALKLTCPTDPGENIKLCNQALASASRAVQIPA